MIKEFVLEILTEIGIVGANHFSKKENANKRSRIRIFIFLVCLLLLVLSFVYIVKYGYY